MARKTTFKKSDAKAPAAELMVDVRVGLRPSAGNATHYANFAEVSYTANDFTVAFVRVPSKMSETLVREAQETGLLQLDADVQVVIPPALVPGLLKALEAARETYEKRFGTMLRMVGEDDADSEA